MLVKANSVNSTNRKFNYKRVRSLFLYIRREFRTQNRPLFHCFANVKSCGNTLKINGALHIRCIFIFSVLYVHQACENNCTTVQSQIVAVYADWSLSSFLLACACSGFLNALGDFPLLQDPRRSSTSNLFSVMTLEKKLCVFSVWFLTKGKFYSISNLKS